MDILDAAKDVFDAVVDVVFISAIDVVNIRMQGKPRQVNNNHYQITYRMLR